MPNQTLSLTQTQSLQMVLAPQLRQSLEMLQLPILELRAMIQKELEQNPTIEEVTAETPAEEAPQETPVVEIEPTAPKEAHNDYKELDFQKEYETLAKLDDEWKDYFFQDMQSNVYSSEAAEKRQFFLDSLPQKESLQQHLLTQLDLASLSEQDHQMGELIIGSLNEDGYLTVSLQELAASANFELARMEDVLTIVHDFHPTGVAARDLRECLLIQLERQGKADSLAGEIIKNHLDKLGARKYGEIAKNFKVSVEEVTSAAKIISSLDPKPGRIYSGEVASYVLPEVILQKVDGEYIVILNDDQLPHLRISNQYRELLGQQNTSADVKSYVRERIRSGAFLIKSIHQRQKTIHRIASEIVKSQKDFLDLGIAHLKPLTMADVARVVGVHETTVSRAVSGKYMQTPVGLFEMKYFFTPGIKTADGSHVSNKTVKDMIANLVALEDPAKPLSDQELMEHIAAKGIHIARRTIAKYRLVLRIQPSHLRKSM